MLSRKVRAPGQPQKMAVGIVGPGQIGKSLLSQLSQQQKYMQCRAVQERLGVDVQLQGVTSSSKMLVGSDQLSLGSWQDAFESSGQKADMQAFTQHFTSLDGEACIFDCTASDAPCQWYEQWLAGGVHIVTPNKKLHSGPLDRFKAVKAQQASGAAHYFFEAACGAGLPILSTLKGVVESGDKVISIEGILSGTLSYIFNTWKAGEPFSAVVLKAKELGFTEPDPREDLSGMDVARKVTILARECGSDAVLENLSVNSLVPEALRDGDVATFLEQLPEHDSDMAAELEKAQASGDVLRYVGKYDAQADGCSITLARYPESHPFAQLKGTDNIVQIRTQRYDEFPLIIRGPGAGPEVTAAGCFADFLQLLRYLGARS